MSESDEGDSEGSENGVDEDNGKTNKDREEDGNGSKSESSNDPAENVQHDDDEEISGSEDESELAMEVGLRLLVDDADLGFEADKYETETEDEAEKLGKSFDPSECCRS